MLRLLYHTREEKGSFKLENTLTTPWLKKQKTKRQITVHRTQHKKFHTRQHEQNLGLSQLSWKVYSYVNIFLINV